MQNSIRDNLTREDIIAEINLLLNADISHKICIVVVEGPDDVTFFRGKLSPNAEIKESFSGKLGVIDIVEAVLDNRVIGICDRDYDLLSENDRIFYYDHSCLEMMLVSDDKAFSNFCYTYYCGPEEPPDLRLHILHDLKWVSFFRRLNSIFLWGIKFTALNYRNAFDRNSMTLLQSTLLQQLVESNPGLADTQSEKLNSIQEEMRTSPNTNTLLEITNGHDFLYYFQLLCCCYSQGKKDHSTNEMFMGLICAFHVDEFKKSMLYSNIAQYQFQKNTVFVSC